MVGDQHQAVARRAQREGRDGRLGLADLALRLVELDTAHREVGGAPLAMRREIGLRLGELHLGPAHRDLALLVLALGEQVGGHGGGDLRLLELGPLLLHRELLLGVGGARLGRHALELSGRLGSLELLLLEIRGEGGVVELDHLLPGLDRRAVLLEPADLELPRRGARHGQRRGLGGFELAGQQEPGAQRAAAHHRLRGAPRRPPLYRRAGAPGEGRGEREEGEEGGGDSVDKHFLESVYEKF